MALHPIPKIPKAVCTAEQKIAYNLAFRDYDLYLNEYKRLPMAFQKAELINYAVHKMIEAYKNSFGHTPGKYDIDGIFCALNFGFESYLKSDRHIFTSYSEIGEMFPISNYLNN